MANMKTEAIDTNLSLPTSMMELELLTSIADKKYSEEEWTVGFPDGSGTASISGEGAFIVQHFYYTCEIIISGGQINGKPIGVIKQKDAEFIAAFCPKNVKRLLKTCSALYDFYLSVQNEISKARQNELIGARPEQVTESEEEHDPFADTS